jgi:hypothetical protein
MDPLLQHPTASPSPRHENPRYGVCFSSLTCAENGGSLQWEDAELLAAIRTLTDDRPTYGYRRIWALLNRQRDQAGQTRLNHKCIYRLMSQSGLPDGDEIFPEYRINILIN